MIDSAWFLLVAMSTIGYGDKVPATLLSLLLCIRHYLSLICWKFLCSLFTAYSCKRLQYSKIRAKA